MQVAIGFVKKGFNKFAGCTLYKNNNNNKKTFSILIYPKNRGVAARNSYMKLRKNCRKSKCLSKMQMLAQRSKTKDLMDYREKMESRSFCR